MTIEPPGYDDEWYEYDWAPRRRLPALAAVVAVAIGLVLGVGGPVLALELLADDEPVVAMYGTAQVDRMPGRLATPTPEARGLGPYEGYGAWVDVFDYAPAYAGPSPGIGPDVVVEMAAAGVRTVYIQAARLDDRSPDGIVDSWLLAEFLLRAHAEGLEVVAWYLPRWSEDDADLERLGLLDGFEVLGQRFDGVAVDIEWTDDDLEVETRNERLITMSVLHRLAHIEDPLGAIVLPPVLIEVVNENFWPDFPWLDIAPLYDVWMPMSYWSFRSDSSGYDDGYIYNEESVRRLRDNIGRPDAPVHPIGGIGGTDGVDDPPDPDEPLTTITEIEEFARSLADTGSIGGSIYDWNTLEPTIRDQVATLVEGAVGPG